MQQTKFVTRRIKELSFLFTTLYNHDRGIQKYLQKRPRIEYFGGKMGLLEKLNRMSHLDDAVTLSIQNLDQGKQNAAKDLFRALYTELKGRARGVLAQWPSGNTLQPTALLHEAYLRLVEARKTLSFESESHFERISARCM